MEVGDQHFRVQGLDRVRIGDDSVMPAIPGAAPKSDLCRCSAKPSSNGAAGIGLARIN